MYSNVKNIYELVVRYFCDEITPEEKKILFREMESNADLRKDCESVRQIRAITSWLPAKGDEALAIGKLLEFKQRHRTKNPFTAWKHAVGYAAAVCLAIVATWYVTLRTVPAGTVQLPVVTEEITTPSGQRVFVRLHDGTGVWLNARSTLRYPNRFEGNERRVMLDGEAFFEVTHNTLQPFVVETEKADIKVLGTKFNVFAYAGNTEFNTSLIEGSVQIFTGKEKEQMQYVLPNERVRLIAGKLQKESFSNTDFLLWQVGIYAFDNVSFGEIMRKLELYYDVTIVEKNEKLDRYKFTGKIRQRDGVENVLRMLQKIHPFSFKKDDELNRITIY